MSEQSESFLRRIKDKVQAQMLSGLLVLVPLGITLLVLQILFAWTAGFLIPFIKMTLPADINEYYVKLTAVGVFIILIYIIGAITAMMYGKAMINVGESMLMRIPVVRNIYSASKQVIEAVSLPNRGAFKAVVVLEYPRPGLKAIGFLTGEIINEKGQSLYKVFIPTAVNPASGFLQFVSASELTVTDISVEEGFKMLISGGIISPDRYSAKASKEVNG